MQIYFATVSFLCLFSDYVTEDRKYQSVLKQVEQTAEQFARVQKIERSFLPNMIFGKKDIVIAVGQDGLVANTMKYLNGQPLLGVNPDTGRWDGVLLPFEPAQMKDVLSKVIAGSYNARRVTMAQVKRLAVIFNCGLIVDEPIGWEENKLVFVVREPYPSRATQAGIVFGKIENGDSFSLISKMPENGVVFSDGIEEDAIVFNSGTEITVGLADKQGWLVI